MIDDWPCLQTLTVVVLLCFCIYSALMSYRMGDFQDSYILATKALKLHPNHVDSKELQAMLQKTFLNT